MRSAARPLYFSIAPGVPQTVLPAGAVVVYSFTLSQSTGGPIQFTARNASQTVVYGVFRGTINQTYNIFSWPTVVDGLHLTLDAGASAIDIMLEASN